MGWYLEALMESHKARLYHVGAKPVKRPTLADANRIRDCTVFTEPFEAMLKQMDRGFRRHMADAVRLIDSTGLRHAGMVAQWSRFSSQVCGAKDHVVYDPDLGRPVYHVVTTANVNDITVAQEMPIEAGATMPSTSAITTMAGGPSSTRPDVGSSLASRSIRR